MGNFKVVTDEFHGGRESPLDTLIDFNAKPVQKTLGILLQDKATNKNIIWATDPPDDVDSTDRHEITVHQLAQSNYESILPRRMKQSDQQQERTKKKGEVFTPAWICCLMNNMLDEQWFRRKSKLFTTLDGDKWTTAESTIFFPQGRRWQTYVDSRRLEICCGEAPYLVSRYDVATGELLPIENRIGLLDRKLRVVSENTNDEATWYKWALRAFESVYGYEYQGDNLLLARVNLLLTFTEYYEKLWGHPPNDKQLTQIACVISWNLWQMDGLKMTVPFGKPIPEHEQMNIWEMLGIAQDIPVVPCVIRDWRGQRRHLFSQMRKGTHPMKFDFVIGNPPYQEEVENNGRANPVYHLFMDEANKIGNCVELITPARFLYDAGQTPKA